ncbi:MAG: class II fructose-bisphosphate aldolase, partial [Propionibacteriaceae bacterium]|nr:class II fructose-bisphosphate aldolase [Propionibacteriaceae bacterium]
MIVTGREAVLEVYAEAASKGWSVPTFCTENQTTTEAILSAAQQRAEELGTKLPVTVAATCTLPHRPQLQNYAASSNWRTGQLLYLGDCEILARPDGDYPDVKVLTHFDHGQPIGDKEALAGDLSRYSSVMFDASMFAWEENLRRTADFVVARGGEFVIEGACDDISASDAGANEQLTTPAKAMEFFEATGVDFIVPNLGTEHRSSAATAKYHPEAARAISALTGPRLVVHGASSAPREDLENAFADGVCKVNIWTTL